MCVCKGFGFFHTPGVSHFRCLVIHRRAPLWHTIACSAKDTARHCARGPWPACPCSHAIVTQALNIAWVVQGGQVCDVVGAAPPQPPDARFRVTAATQLEIIRSDSKGLGPAGAGR